MFVKNQLVFVRLMRLSNFSDKRDIYLLIYIYLYKIIYEKLVPLQLLYANYA